MHLIFLYERSVVYGGSVFGTILGRRLEQLDKTGSRFAV